MAAPTILAIMHRGHEDPSTALTIKTISTSPRKNTAKKHIKGIYLSRRTLAPQALNLAIAIHLVVLEHRQLRLLALMLDLLGRGVDLLLALLGAAAQTEDEVQGGFLLDVVVREGASVFELLAGED